MRYYAWASSSRTRRSGSMSCPTTLKAAPKSLCPHTSSAAKLLLAASKDSVNLGFKMDGLKVCHNLFWLKGSGKFTLHGKLQIQLSSTFLALLKISMPSSSPCQAQVHDLRLLVHIHCNQIYLQCQQSNINLNCNNLMCYASKIII